MRSIESMTERAPRRSCRGLVHRVVLPKVGSRYLIAWLDKKTGEWQTHVTKGFVGDGVIRRAATRKELASIATVATFASHPGACKRVRKEREARGGKLRPAA